MKRRGFVKLCASAVAGITASPELLAQNHQEYHRYGRVALIDEVQVPAREEGVLKELFVKEGSPKSVYSFIQDAHEAGAKFYCCSPNLDLFDMTEDDLIPECEGIVGGAHLIEQVMEEDCRVLSY